MITQQSYSAINLLIRTLLWLGTFFSRQTSSANTSEVVALKGEIERLKSENEILRKRLRGNPPRHHTWQEKLHVLWHMEVFQVPRRQVAKVFGISCSTYYRWLEKAKNGTLAGPAPKNNCPSNKTPEALTQLVWDLFNAAPTTGRIRLAQMIQRLGVFISPSAVRNILRRARPNPPNATQDAAATTTRNSKSANRLGIVSRYPNHVWSVDLTVVKRWLLWPTYVLVIVDHYSRRAISIRPLEGPNAGWVTQALEDSFRQLGSPRHLISDQGAIFTGTAFADLLNKWDVKHRLGAIGKHGSISVTERLIKSLKYEWLFRSPLIQGFNHLTVLCDSFMEWYNHWRPHSFLGGATPDERFFGRTWERPLRDAKEVPNNIETKVFSETRVAAYRLKKAA